MLFKQFFCALSLNLLLFQTVAACGPAWFFSTHPSTNNTELVHIKSNTTTTNASNGNNNDTNSSLETHTNNKQPNNNQVAEAITFWTACPNDTFYPYP